MLQGEGLCPFRRPRFEVKILPWSGIIAATRHEVGPSRDGSRRPCVRGCSYSERNSDGGHTSRPGWFSCSPFCSAGPSRPAHSQAGPHLFERRAPIFPGPKIARARTTELDAPRELSLNQLPRRPRSPWARSPSVKLVATPSDAARGTSTIRWAVRRFKNGHVAQLTSKIDQPSFVGFGRRSPQGGPEKTCPPPKPLDTDNQWQGVKRRLRRNLTLTSNRRKYTMRRCHHDTCGGRRATSRLDPEPRWVKNGRINAAHQPGRRKIAKRKKRKNTRPRLPGL